jgi:hypothetical protein
MSALGNCAQVAFDLVAEHRTWVLCHGTVVRQEDGLAHFHAWVERTAVQYIPLHDGSDVMAVVVTTAIDRSNGHDVELPAEYYRKVGQAHDVTEYEWSEALTLATTTGHYGPWT